MPFRFWRRKKIFPGVTLNLSKSGLSTSFGFKGAHVTFGKRGIRQTVGLPGTGLSFTQAVPKTRKMLATSASLEQTQSTMSVVPAIDGVDGPQVPLADPVVESIEPPTETSANKLIFGLAIGGVLIFVCGVTVGLTLASNLFPPPPPKLDMNAVNTSAMLTAWAPATLTQAAKPTSTLPPIPTGTAFPSPTFFALPTLAPLPTLASFSTAAPYVAPVQPAAPKSSHPAGTSGKCVDGTYTSAQHSQGACSYHDGIATWWGP